MMKKLVSKKAWIITGITICIVIIVAIGCFLLYPKKLQGSVITVSRNGELLTIEYSVNNSGRWIRYYSSLENNKNQNTRLVATDGSIFKEDDSLRRYTGDVGWHIFHHGEFYTATCSFRGIESGVYTLESEFAGIKVIISDIKVD